MSAKNEVEDTSSVITPTKLLACWCCGNFASQCVGPLTTDTGIAWCRSCRDGQHKEHVYLRDNGKTLYNVYLHCATCKVQELEIMERWEVDALFYSQIGPDVCYSCRGDRTVASAARRQYQLLTQPSTSQETVKEVVKPEPLLAACYRGKT